MTDDLRRAPDRREQIGRRAQTEGMCLPEQARRYPPPQPGRLPRKAIVVALGVPAIVLAAGAVAHLRRTSAAAAAERPSPVTASPTTVTIPLHEVATDVVGGRVDLADQFDLTDDDHDGLTNETEREEADP